MFDPFVWFPGVLMTCFVVLERTHNPEDGLPRVLRTVFVTFFLCLFPDLLFNSD